MREYPTVHPSTLNEAHRAVERRAPGAFFEGSEKTGGRYLVSGKEVAVLVREQSSGKLILRFPQDLHG